MSLDAYVNYVEYYLPAKTLTNAKINDVFPEWSIEKISAKTGIYQRHIASDDEFVSDLAVKAADKLFVNQKIIRKEDIDFILLCTQSPDYFLPTTACLVQLRLGLNTNIGALDYNLGCSGYVYGLMLAKGLIASQSAKNVLLITSETYSKFIGDKDKSNRTIFGDAAAATIISTNKIGIGGKIGQFDYGTDGKGGKNLIVKYGAIKHPNRALAETRTDNYGNSLSDANLYMNGREIFSFTLKSVPKLIRNTLAINNVTSDDIDSYIFHQANDFMLEHLRKKIKIPPEKFVKHLSSCGNTVSSTIPIALFETYKSRGIKPKENILLAGFGVGYSWGGVVLKF